MVEAQAVDRVHRIGQCREVLTTRYMTKNSIETVSNDQIGFISYTVDISKHQGSRIAKYRVIVCPMGAEG